MAAGGGLGRATVALVEREGWRASRRALFEAQLQAQRRAEEAAPQRARLAGGPVDQYRLRALAGVPIVLLVTVITLFGFDHGVLISLSAYPLHPGHVEVPNPSAPPGRFLGAYLRAMNAGDDDTVRALLTHPDNEFDNRDRCLVALDAIKIPPMDISPDIDAGEGEKAEGWATFRPTYAHSRFPWGCGDGVFTSDSFSPDKKTANIFYELVRRRNSDPWRIAGWGNP